MSERSGATIAAAMAADRPVIEPLVYGTTDPSTIADKVRVFCRRHLGADVAGWRFYAASVGSVHGLDLEDGRAVVVKVHPPAPDVGAHLAAAVGVQHALHDDGFPAPAPLLGPSRLGRGVAVVEALVDAGSPPDGHDRGVRHAMAAGLADLVARTCDRPAPPGLRAGWRGEAPGELWPEPHSPLFDFAATASGAEWIDAVAAEARARATEVVGVPVVAHGDWRTEHVRVRHGELLVVYDWDSVALLPESRAVGAAAHAFTADWAAAGASLPSLEEMLGFVDDYEVARGRRFDRDARRRALAWCAYSLAYGARCQHALGSDPPARASFAALLHAHARDLLAT